MTAVAVAAILFSGHGCRREEKSSKDAPKEETPREAKGDKTIQTVETKQKKAEHPPLSSEKLSASHILLMYEGAPRKPPHITRTKEDALAEAQKIKKQLNDGADFAELAKEHSDCPSGKKNEGNLGVFPANKMVPEFSLAVLKMKAGEISEPVESAFGYHIIKRQEVEEARARHVLVMHEESSRKPPNITRTKEEATKLIKEIKAKLDKGADFAEIAKEHSDCPSGKRQGGDLGLFGRGQMAKPFEDATWALEENAVSDIVETDFGYHIIQRLPITPD